MQKRDSIICLRGKSSDAFLEFCRPAESAKKLRGGRAGDAAGVPVGKA